MATAIGPLNGRVDFGDGERLAQATMGDVARAATVSLINTATDATESTAHTDATGTFVLRFPDGWVPIADRVYVLEASKGLDDNRPSSAVARVRTLVRFQGGWQAITGTGIVTVDSSTTALSIMQAVYQVAGRSGSSAAGYIGLIDEISGSPGVPDGLTDGQTVVGEAAYQQVYGHVRTALSHDQDPVASIRYDGVADRFSVFVAAAPVVTAMSPTFGPPGSQVILYGSGFAPQADSNTVWFNGTAATVLQASGTSLTVRVPTSATTGPISVATADGASNELSFTVVPAVGGAFTAR